MWQLLFYFAILSGFSVHLSNADTPLNSRRSVWAYYTNRLDRVLLVIWFGYALMYFLFAVDPKGLYGGFSLGFWSWYQYILCPLTANVYASLSTNNQNCPNVPAWFIGAMIPSWLAYPLLQRLLNAVGHFGAAGYVSAALLVWAVTVFPFYAFPQPAVEAFFATSPLAFTSAFFVGGATAGIVKLHAADRVVRAPPEVFRRHEDAKASEREPLLPERSPRKSVAPVQLTTWQVVCSIPWVLKHYLSQRALLRGFFADVAMLLLVLGMTGFSDAQLQSLGNGSDKYARGLAIPFFMAFIYGSAAQGARSRHNP